MRLELTKAGQLLPSKVSRILAPSWARDQIDGGENRDLEDCADKLACFGLVEPGTMADARDDLTHISLSRDSRPAGNHREGLWLDGLLF